MTLTNKKNDTFQTYLILFVKAFLTSFALLVSFHEPLAPAAFESTIDFIIASIYELLGTYNFTFLLLLMVMGYFYWQADSKGLKEKGRAYTILAAFFAGCLLLGGSYHEVKSWAYCFGSIVNFMKFLLAFVGYTLLLRTLMLIVVHMISKCTFTEDRQHFFSNHGFLKAFFIILASYMPFYILSFPGNLCWDVIGQIEQVIFDVGYSTHHPLVHTFLVGGLVELGNRLFSSYEIGLAIYVFVQMAMLAAALAATVAVLVRKKAKRWLILCLMTVYCIAPTYSNIATTAIKDVPFCAFVIGYVICYALILETPKLLKDKKFVFVFILMQLGTILFRNNGLPMVLISGIVGFIFLFKKYSLKERISGIIVFFGAAFLAGQLILSAAAQLTGAAAGSKGEILSIPFQQTARYLQLYQTELDTEEKEAIEAVLGEVSEVAAQYNPAISDPVKAKFRKDASMGEIVDYIGAWFQGFIKHPAVYFEAFFVHVYGWFTPSVSNAVRYEADYEVIHQGGLFPNAEKLLIFYYRFTERFTLLGMLNNVGLSVWGLFFLCVLQRRNRQSAQLCATMPLWVSLLICMASPCFLGHPRYAFPIMFTLPFLLVFTLLKKSDIHAEKEVV